MKTRCCTHNCSGNRSHYAVQDERRDEAVLFNSRVRLHQVSIVAEEALDVDTEDIGALKVVSQQHSASHYDQL